MYSRVRYARMFCRQFIRLKPNRSTSVSAFLNISKINPSTFAIPTTLGFSLFTWIGFDTKITPEDELIQTIKHCVLFIQRNEYDKAERLLHVALRQAQQMQHQNGITYIYDIMANLALQREQLDKAKKLFVSVSQRLMADGVKPDDLRIVHISLKLARISHLKKEYDVAQLGFDWSIKKLQDGFGANPNEDQLKILAIAEDWYGRLFVDCNQLENGLNLMVKSLDRTMDLKEIDEEEIVLQLNDIGTVCERMDKLDESIQYFNKAIELGKIIRDLPYLGTFYVNLGRVYIKKQMFEEARKACGFGWRLGHDHKDDEIKEQADLCIQQLRNLN